MFLRRFYYLNQTGAMLASYVMSGSFVMPTQDFDYAHDPGLMPYADDRGAVGLFEWTVPDAAIEAEFAASYGQSVDVGALPHELAFDYTEPPAPPEPPNDADLILDIIKGVSE